MSYNRERAYKLRGRMQLWSHNFTLEKKMHDTLPSQDVFPQSCL